MGSSLVRLEQMDGVTHDWLLWLANGLRPHHAGDDVSDDDDDDDGDGDENDLNQILKAMVWCFRPCNIGAT